GVTGAALAASKPRNRDEPVAFQNFRAAAGRGEGGDGAFLWRERQRLVGQPDSQLRLPAVSHGQGFAHRRRNEQRSRRDGRRFGPVREWLVARGLSAEADARREG